MENQKVGKLAMVGGVAFHTYGQGEHLNLIITEVANFFSLQLKFFHS